MGQDDNNNSLFKSWLDIFKGRYKKSTSTELKKEENKTVEEIQQEINELLVDMPEIWGDLFDDGDD